MPTILDALDIPIPADVQGRSLLPIMEGTASSARSYAFSGRFPAVMAGVTRQPGVGHLFDGWAGSDRVVEALTVTDDRWALIVSPLGRPSELYDLRLDPEQKQNVLDANAEVAKDMRNRLIEFLWEHGAAPERLAPFTDGASNSGLDEGSPLWTFEDDRGKSIAFPDEQQAIALALSKDGSRSRPVTRTTFGNLLAKDPKGLIQTHGQYYWAEDLV